MSTSLPLDDAAGVERLQQQVEKSLLAETAIASLLRVALEPIALNEQLQRILDLLVKLPWLAIEAKGCIALVEGEPSALVLAAQVGLSEDARARTLQGLVGCCLCGLGILRDDPTGRVAGCREKVDPSLPAHGQYCVPICCGGRWVGLLNLFLSEGHEQSPDEARFLQSVADVIAGVIGGKQVEETLRQSEERFELAVRGTDAGIWDWDLRTDSVYYSPRWKSMLGFDETELNGGYSDWESRLHPEDRDRALAAIHDYLEGRRGRYELEHRLRHKDGSYRWIIARGAKVCDRDGKPYRVVGSHVDITERKRVEEQLRHREAHLIAVRKIVKRLLPGASLKREGVEVHGFSAPADYASGDHFDYFTRDDGSIVAVIADVAGHGIDAALLMTMTHAWLRSLAGLGLDLGETLARLNSILIEQTDGDRFITLLMLKIDPKTGTLFYANAGHPPGYVLSKDGALKSTLDSLSLPLVIEPDERFPVGERSRLESGDLVLLATDGIFEARSPAGEQFGVDRAFQAIRARIDRPNEEILDGLHDAVVRFTGSGDLLDDVTAVLVRIL